MIRLYFPSVLGCRVFARLLCISNGMVDFVSIFLIFINFAVAGSGEGYFPLPALLSLLCRDGFHLFSVAGFDGNDDGAGAFLFEGVRPRGH